MFIIAAAGTVKALVAVTISLHPGTHHVPASYTVQQGDSLSAIAARTYGKAADWPAVWWANRHQVANPNQIAAGQRLRLPAERPGAGVDGPRRRSRLPSPVACLSGGERPAGESARRRAGLYGGSGVLGRGELVGHRSV